MTSLRVIFLVILFSTFINNLSSTLRVIRKCLKNHSLLRLRKSLKGLSIKVIRSQGVRWFDQCGHFSDKGETVSIFRDFVQMSLWTAPYEFMVFT